MSADDTVPKVFAIASSWALLFTRPSLKAFVYSSVSLSGVNALIISGEARANAPPIVAMAFPAGPSLPTNPFILSKMAGILVPSIIGSDNTVDATIAPVIRSIPPSCCCPPCGIIAEAPATPPTARAPIPSAFPNLPPAALV